jgi:antitoxin ParD1/3/4
MGKNISVSLGLHFDAFVNQVVADGRFQNASEVIRAGLRLLEEEEAKIQLLRSSIDEGFQSGFVKNYSADEHLEKLKSLKRKGG